MIIGLSGKKQSGKNTSYKLIERMYGAYRPVRSFSFAEPLKRMCVDILGLRPEQVWGTDEEKNSIVTHLLWENFPIKRYRDGFGSFFGQDREHEDIPWLLGKGFTDRKSGPMTGREVLQYWGTDIFRRQYPTVWVANCIRKIKGFLEESPGAICVVTDVRFPDEVKAIQNAGGKVLRLTRRPLPDSHASEFALDDFTEFDEVVANDTLTLTETDQVVGEIMSGWIGMGSLS